MIDLEMLLQKEVQKFIIDNEKSVLSKLAFQKNPFPSIDYRILLNQIESRSKAKVKLPTWFEAENIIYPSKISVEQTSSEITANYKSQIVSGETLIDLSGGFGVDDYYFAKKIKQITHCEINTELSELVKHNFKQLNISNIECFSNDSFAILKQNNKNYSWIYIDPSRRNDSKGKVFMLKDCTPNVPELQDFYYNYSNNILIKTAPILDIKAGLLELKNVKNIHIVAVDNEVKELLWEIEKEYIGQITIKTINFNKDKEEKFEFVLDMETYSNFSLPKKYLYEPNAAIMKSGGFSIVGRHYNLDKLHTHSHLFTSNECIDFPGRIFEIQKIIDYSKTDMKEHLENQKANVTVRNFPETVENIRKKWKIKDGGTTYSFFTTDRNDNKIVLICTKK